MLVIVLEKFFLVILCILFLIGYILLLIVRILQMLLLIFGGVHLHFLMRFLSLLIFDRCFSHFLWGGVVCCGFEDITEYTYCVVVAMVTHNSGTAIASDT